MIATAAIAHIVCKQTKLKALLTGIAFQPVRQIDAISGSSNENEHCKCVVQWYTIATMIIGLIIFIVVTTRKCRICRENYSLIQFV